MEGTERVKQLSKKTLVEVENSCMKVKFSLQNGETGVEKQQSTKAIARYSKFVLFQL